MLEENHSLSNSAVIKDHAGSVITAKFTEHLCRTIISMKFHFSVTEITFFAIYRIFSDYLFGRTPLRRLLLLLGPMNILHKVNISFFFSSQGVTQESLFDETN